MEALRDEFESVGYNDSLMIIDSCNAGAASYRIWPEGEFLNGRYVLGSATILIIDGRNTARLIDVLTDVRDFSRAVRARKACHQDH